LNAWKTLLLIFLYLIINKYGDINFLNFNFGFLESTNNGALDSTDSGKNCGSNASTDNLNLVKNIPKNSDNLEDFSDGHNYLPTDSNFATNEVSISTDTTLKPGRPEIL